MLSYKLGLLCSLQSPISSEWVRSDDTESGELSLLSHSQLGATTLGKICTAAIWKHVFRILRAICLLLFFVFKLAILVFAL